MGADGARSPERVAGVIRALDADVVALQEVESRLGVDADAHQLNYLAQATGFVAVAGPTVLRPDSHYGNALLTRLPVLAVRRLDLSVRGFEPRGALDVDLETGGEPLRIIATHLGLRHRERREQVTRLLSVLEQHADRRLLLLGDINEWLPGSRTLGQLHARLGHTPAPRTYPARRPLFALDRIWATPMEMVADLTRYDTPLARVASDHLPVSARLRISLTRSAAPAPVASPAVAADAVSP
ncbi:MAG: endonuclease [Gammaproteobacteria bacterium]|nr:endonuclease [Gammaproteobacteria bacterium]NIR83280.1 endonuclease [Gammaproteobacteria bacterium]NIR91080.1 endonuclease [Gammaproteobacteria bacterium]NIU04447.1 endonuclease [Gammaproteobacteria bacterium]NIW87083.1 endonuclease [Gammaproteobacteria bacterium]